MSKLTKEARGRDCQMRSPFCNYNPETTVLAHYRLAGTCGVGMKPNDLQGAWLCSSCHDLSDSRIHPEMRAEARLMHAEAVMRTQDILIKEGKVKL